MLTLQSHAPLPTRTAWPLALLVFASFLFVSQPLLHAQNGSYVKPGISVGEFFDDNLFMVSGAAAQSDIVSRVSPALELGYRAPRGHVIGDYTFDAEIYPNHPELNMPFVRQTASTDLQYQLSPKLSFATTGSYDRTHTPQDLSLTGLSSISTGLAIGRIEADRIQVNPQLTDQMTGRTRALLSYTWSRDGLADTLSSQTNEAGLRIEHQATGTTMLGAGYTYRQFGFGADDNSRSNVFLLGLGHRFSSLTNIELWVGPRVSAGAVQPEITATLNHQFQRGTMALNYQQQQTTSLGELVPLNVQALNLLLSARTSRLVEIGVAPGFFRTVTGTTSSLLVYVAATTLTLHLTPQLAMLMSYQYTRQQGTFANLDQVIPHQVALVSFAVTPMRGVEF